MSQLQESHRWLELAQGAWQAAISIFDADSIHNILKESIVKLLNKPAVKTVHSLPISQS